MRITQTTDIFILKEYYYNTLKYNSLCTVASITPMEAFLMLLSFFGFTKLSTPNGV